MPSNGSVMRVVDDAMLIDGIVLDKYQQQAADSNENTSVVDLAPTADILLLSFKSIAKIENLIGLENLTKLCLDNNSIEDILNLDSLKRLRWLDLSFNKIKKIQGLRTLTELEDLSLFSNRITVIEDIEYNPKLKCLSIGNNKIDTLDQIVRFRQLPELKMLTLAGNPICEEPDYRVTVLAYVSNLKYLDYAVVEPADIFAAKEQYHDELLDIEEKEAVVSEKINRDKSTSEYLKQLDEGSILFSYTLFDDMFNDDAEVEKLKHLPGIKEAIESFKGTFKLLSDDYIRIAMEKFTKKKKDIEFFQKAVDNVRTKDDKECTQLIDNFTLSKKLALGRDLSHTPTANCLFELKSIQSLLCISFTVLCLLCFSLTISPLFINTTEFLAEADNKEKVQIVKRLSEELDKVCDELMSIEIREVEKYEALVDGEDGFENKMLELKAQSLDMQNGFFRSVEKMEDDFLMNMKSVAIDLMERLTREELAEDYLDDEAMGLVQDREACMTVISASHDLHVGRILKREDEARAIETRKTQELVMKSNAFERSRNRDHVLQIHDFSESSKAQLSALLSTEDDEAEEES